MVSGPGQDGGERGPRRTLCLLVATVSSSAIAGAVVGAAASSASSASTSTSTSTVFSVVRLSTKAHWRLSAPRVFLEGGLLVASVGMFAPVCPRFIPAKVGRRREYRPAACG